MCSNGCYSQQALAKKEPYVNRCKCGYSDCQNCYTKNKSRDCGGCGCGKQPTERYYSRSAKPLQDIQNKHYNNDPRRSHNQQLENYRQSRRALEHPAGRHGQPSGGHPMAIFDPRQYAMHPQQVKSAWMAATYEEVNHTARGTTAVRMGVQAQWNY